MKKRLLSVAALVGLAIALVAAPGAAQTATNTSHADAFGLKVTVSPFQQDPIRVGPTPKVNVFMPPQQEAASDQVAEAGPVPDDGALVQYVRAVKVTGDGDVAAGTATATAETAALSLFGGQITADVLKAVSTTTCAAPGDAASASAGSQVVGLNLGGNEIPLTPEPNEVTIRLAQEDGTGLADVRVYEVVPDGEGRGWTTRMLHIFTLDPLTQAVNGEIIVGEAHSAVTCGTAAAGPNGATNGAGGDNEVLISQTVDPGAPSLGQSVTYDITVRNTGTQNCTVYEVTDRLAPVLTYASAGGFLADVEGVVDGREVLFSNPVGWPLEAGKSLDGTVTATVAEDAAPGTYTNTVIARTTCGVFTGVGAPITIGGVSAAGPLPGDEEVEGANTVAAGPLPSTGATGAFAGLALLTLAGGATTLLRRRP